MLQGSPRLLVLLCAIACSTAAAQQHPASVAAEPGPATVQPTPPDPVPPAPPWQQHMLQLLQQPAVAGAHWGVVVSTLGGTPLFSLNEGQLFRPASTAKLFTTAAAMALLGPEHRVTTTARGFLDPASGTVAGDLILLGAGDPAFGTVDLPFTSAPQKGPTAQDLAAMADQLVSHGLRHIAGNVVGDDSLFSDEGPPEGWAAEDLLWGYGALPSALSFADNELRLTVSSPGAGSTTTPLVQLDQMAPYLTVQQDLLSGQPEVDGGRHVGVVASAGSPLTLQVFGSMPTGSGPLVEHLAVPEPAAYAATVLRQLLLDRGVHVDGIASARHAPRSAPMPFMQLWRRPSGCAQAAEGAGQGCTPSCPVQPPPAPVLAAHLSGSLAQDVVFTLKTSANLHAELMLRALGLREACPGAPMAVGSGVLHRFLAQAGLPEGDVVLYDGSGLSTKDLVTPRSEAQLLAFAATQTWFAPWKAALPIGGVDGTLASRFTTAPLRGNVLAKTGTLGETRALAGYVRCASGQELIVVVLDDNHEPGSTADRTAMDEMVALVAANN